MFVNFHQKDLNNLRVVTMPISLHMYMYLQIFCFWIFIYIHWLITFMSDIFSWTIVLVQWYVLYCSEPYCSGEQCNPQASYFLLICLVFNSVYLGFCSDISWSLETCPTTWAIMLYKTSFLQWLWNLTHSVMTTTANGNRNCSR